MRQSTSQLGFINALHVQVASIGTVPNSFVLFLFYCKATCFRHIKPIQFVVNSTFTIVFVHIINFCVFIFQSGKIPLIACCDIPIKHPKAIIRNTQFLLFSITTMPIIKIGLKVGSVHKGRLRLA